MNRATLKTMHARQLNQKLNQRSPEIVDRAFGFNAPAPVPSSYAGGFRDIAIPMPHE